MKTIDTDKILFELKSHAQALQVVASKSGTVWFDMSRGSTSDLDKLAFLLPSEVRMLADALAPYRSPENKPRNNAPAMATIGPEGEGA